MRVVDVAKILASEIIVGGGNLEEKVKTACGADLLSDVMAFGKDSTLLLTGLVNLQVIRIAELLEIRTIVFVRGKRPSQDMMDLAREKEITLLSTGFSMFISCGKLYSTGISGGAGIDG